MKAYVGIIIFLLSISTHAQVLRFRPGQFSLFSSFEIFNTTTNFDQTGGSFTKLDTDHSYANNQINMKLQYDLNYNWAGYGGFTFSMAESNDGIDKRNFSNFTKFTGGLQYKVLKKPFLIVPQVQFVLPFENVDAFRDSTLASDGAIEMEFGSWFQKKIWKLYTFAYLGYDYRDHGYSSLIKYKVGTYTRLSGFYVGGDLNGFQSISDDKYTDDITERTSVTDRVNGGSLKYNSINPNLLNVNVWGGFIVKNNYLFKIGYNQDINGASYARGNTIFFGIDIRNFYLKSKEERQMQRRLRKTRNLDQQFSPEPEEDTIDDSDLDTDKLEKELEFQLEKKFDKRNGDDVLRKYDY